MTKDVTIGLLDVMIIKTFYPLSLRTFFFYFPLPANLHLEFTSLPCSLLFNLKAFRVILVEETSLVSQYNIILCSYILTFSYLQRNIVNKFNVSLLAVVVIRGNRNG